MHNNTIILEYDNHSINLQFLYPTPTFVHKINGNIVDLFYSCYIKLYLSGHIYDQYRFGFVYLYKYYVGATLKWTVRNMVGSLL
jgi:hypothetical protein